MASMASAEADAQWFYPSYPTYTYSSPSYYYPSFHTYPTYQYTAPSYYYPSYVYPPKVVSSKVVPQKAEVQTPEVTIKKQEAPRLRPIVPVFDYLRSGNSQLTYEEDETNILTYSVPYTQAYLNRIPAF